MQEVSKAEKRVFKDIEGVSLGKLRLETNYLLPLPDTAHFVPPDTSWYAPWSALTTAPLAILLSPPGGRRGAKAGLAELMVVENGRDLPECYLVQSECPARFSILCLLLADT
ncbi:hypothetical protein E2C01_070854 [Portunus trituberculatus]|uniref:Uncharacterized protein n=1 Tax=Portunus trituberculatus TaxID=210409 RepID=A0A5B7I2G6_PORTR|nr:hypothetical protein [Portunus trituberculatus]